jgi:hypothetical protein
METGLPLDGVSVIPMTGKVKLTTEVFVGGVSDIVTLKNASPPPQFVVHAVFNPLHELSASIAAKAIIRRVLFDFIHSPHDWIWQTTPEKPDGWESPSQL